MRGGDSDQMPSGRASGQMASPWSVHILSPETPHLRVDPCCWLCLCKQSLWDGRKKRWGRTRSLLPADLLHNLPTYQQLDLLIFEHGMERLPIVAGEWI
jgi:hypothetical protein